MGLACVLYWRIATIGEAGVYEQHNFRDLDNRLMARLKARAAQGGRSVEEEAQLILQWVLEKDESTTFASLASSLFGIDWGVELGAHPVVQMRSVDGLED